MRREKFPEKPSRLNAIFVSPSISALEVYVDYMRKPYVYEVQWSGPYHLTSGELVPDISAHAHGLGGNLDIAEYRSELYWTGYSDDQMSRGLDPDTMPEYVIDADNGEAWISRRVPDEEVAAAMDREQWPKRF